MSLNHIATVELDSTASSLNLNSISQNYEDLVLIASFRSDRAGTAHDDLHMTINGATTNYTVLRFYSDGDTVENGVKLTGDTYMYSGTINGSSSSANTYSTVTTYFANYSSSSASKKISIENCSENNAADGWLNFMSGLWDDTSAITSLSFFSGSGNNFVSGSKVSLYGTLSGGTDGTVTTT